VCSVKLCIQVLEITVGIHTTNTVLIPITESLPRFCIELKKQEGSS